MTGPGKQLLLEAKCLLEGLDLSYATVLRENHSLIRKTLVWDETTRMQLCKKVSWEEQKAQLDLMASLEIVPHLVEW